MMSPEFARHRRRIGGLLVSGRLPFDYKPEGGAVNSREDVVILEEQLAVAADRAQSWKNMHDLVKSNADRVRAAAEEMLAELLGDFSNGVANGYFPEVGVKLDRWCDALGKPRIKRFRRDGVAD